MKKNDLMSISLSTGTYTDFIQTITDYARSRTSRYVCVANVHMLVEGYKSSSFGALVRDADVVTPDGKPLTWALRLLYGVRQQRVCGMDLLPSLLEEAQINKTPVYFYGGSTSMLSCTEKYLYKNYPFLSIAGMYSPPFRELTEEEMQEHADAINASGAGLVFVVLGCPKQEKWMAAMKGRVHACMIGVGGALPVMAGMQKRAPGWMQQNGLEWLFRLGQEPRRLFGRYFTTNSTFLLLLAKEMLRTKHHA